MVSIKVGIDIDKDSLGMFYMKQNMIIPDNTFFMQDIKLGNL
jgi:hypothetical protein